MSMYHLLLGLISEHLWLYSVQLAYLWSHMIVLQVLKFSAVMSECVCLMAKRQAISPWLFDNAVRLLYCVLRSYIWPFYYTYTTWQCQWRHLVFRLSVHPFVRTNIVTAISYERLVQSWWNLRGIFNSPYWWTG